MKLKDKDDRPLKEGTYRCRFCEFRSVSLDEYSDHMRAHDES